MSSESILKEIEKMSREDIANWINNILKYNHSLNKMVEGECKKCLLWKLVSLNPKIKALVIKKAKIKGSEK